MPYLIHVLGRSGDCGSYASFWSSSDDLGPAIAESVTYAKHEIGLDEPRASSVEYAEFESGHPDEAFETESPGLWSFTEVNSWDLEVDPIPDFWFPCGVVPAAREAGIDPDTITEAFSMGSDRDEVVVVVDARRLWQVYLALFRALPARDGLEIRLMDHWLSSASTEVWIGHPRYRDDAIANYLSENAQALLDNGGVAISTYARQARCTLTLDDHKLIKLYAPNPRPIEDAVAQLRRLGFPEALQVRSIAVGCEHYHFAPPGAMPPAELRAQLQRDDFRRVRLIPSDGEDGPSTGAG